MGAVSYPPRTPPDDPRRASGRIPRDRREWVTTDAFDSTYYSGLDVAIYFGPFYLDEIVNIQYNVTQNVVPYYGYHAYVFNHVAQGTRLVMGSFSINFQESFYLLSLLDALSARAAAAPAASPAAPPTDADGRRLATIRQALTGEVTIQEFLSMARDGGYTGESRGRLKSIGDAFQSALWGGPPDPKAVAPATDPARPLFDRGPPGGFDIYLRYGEPDRAPEREIGPPGFPRSLAEISRDPATGQRFPDGRRAHPPPVGTLHRLTRVYLTAVGQAVDDSGRPILEVYNFLAASIDEPRATPF